MLGATLFAAGEDLLNAAIRGAAGGAIKVAIAAAVVVVGLLTIFLFKWISRPVREEPIDAEGPETPTQSSGEASLFTRMFRAARDAGASDPEGGGPAAHARINRRIVLLGFVIGTAGLALGLVFLHSTARPDSPNTDWGTGAKAVAFLTFASYFVGIGVGCLFTPSRFYEGPVGQKWLRLIGIQSVPAARLVCLALVALVVGLVSLMAVAARLR